MLDCFVLFPFLLLLDPFPSTWLSQLALTWGFMPGLILSYAILVDVTGEPTLSWETWCVVDLGERGVG